MFVNDLILCTGGDLVCFIFDLMFYAMVIVDYCYRSLPCMGRQIRTLRILLIWQVWNLHLLQNGMELQ